MDGCCKKKSYNNGLFDSSSYILYGHNVRANGKVQADVYNSHPLGGNDQAKEGEEMSIQVYRPASVLKKLVASTNNEATDARIATPIKMSLEPYCQVKVESINQLKDSTRKLLNLLEDIQSKTYSKVLPSSETYPDTNEVIVTQITTDAVSYTDVTEAALKKLEAQTKAINTIRLEDDDDDCSIFKRLTRKCHCLNQQEYNDFIIHFNEETKYFTSTTGEIIKNMRILKKFLYMGGTYTRNALIFLNEGLDESAYTEKVEITQGCSHSDMCNVFEDHSMVIMCISLPCKFNYYGDAFTQNLAASFIYKLAQLEEGRRYLKFTSRITNDIKKVLRKNGSKLDKNTTESLNAILNLMHSTMTQNVRLAYSCRQNNEDYVSENIKALTQYRNYMTLDEAFIHLDLIHNLSKEVNGKAELTLLLPSLLILFQKVLKEYDNSEMNIIITDILNNIVSMNMLKQKETLLFKTMMVADTATEPVKMKNVIVQMPPLAPPQKKHPKKANKSKSHINSKFRQASRRKDRGHVIVVPIERK